eukprot:s595_g9.t1
MIIIITTIIIVIIMTLIVTIMIIVVIIAIITGMGITVFIALIVMLVILAFFFFVIILVILTIIFVITGCRTIPFSYEATARTAQALPEKSHQACVWVFGAAAAASGILRTIRSENEPDKIVSPNNRHCWKVRFSAFASQELINGSLVDCRVCASRDPKAEERLCYAGLCRAQQAGRQMAQQLQRVCPLVRPKSPEAFGPTASSTRI